jgi:hypothetical protein
MGHAHMTRQDFFKTAGTAALGVAAAGIVAKSPAADAQANDLLAVAKSRGLSPDEARVNARRGNHHLDRDRLSPGGQRYL